MVPGQYSLSINFRQTGGNIVTNITRLMTLYWPIGYLCRHLLESGDSYDKVLDKLQNEQLVAPCYITLCRPDSVTVITRDRSNAVSARTSHSHCVQTNKDYGEIGGNNILYSVERYSVADKIISNFKGDNYHDLVSALSVKPIINDETIYLTVMIPGKSIIETIIT